MKRAVSLVGRILLVVAGLQLTGLAAASAQAASFTEGDVFVGVGNGQVQWRLPDGTLQETLTTNAETGFTTGMAFDSTGRLYVTNFDANEVSLFDTDGTLLGSFGSGYDSNPESIVFGSSGHAFVGQAFGTADVLEFDSSGGSVATYDPAIEVVGTDWIELAADQCTLYYTSEGTSIKRFDVCEAAQLGDFATDLPGSNAFALRILPAGAGVLVADREQILLLDGISGSVLQAYDDEGQDNWFALNLDPDGTSFWSADFGTADVYKFDILTGEVLQTFNTDTGPNTVFGLTVAGEITVAEPEADLAIDKTDGNPDPCPGDPPISCGPDPVSSGQPVAYGISVTNNGPDAASGVTVTDTSEGGAVQSGSGMDWSCDPVVENTLMCHYTGNEGVLPADSTAPPLTVVVRAPDNPGSEDITMTDIASVSADQPDPNTDNNTDIEDTTVLGTTSEGSEDHAAGFFDNTTTLTIATTRDQTSRFHSSVTIHPDPGLEPGVVTIDEFPATEPPYNTLCGNKTCDAQVQVTVLPAGGAAADNAIEIHLFYVKDAKQGSTIWVKGDGEAFGTSLQNCIVRGIADPPKCVNSRRILKNGDRDIMLLWRDGGDPWGGKG